MGRLDAEQRARLARRQTEASLGETVLEPDIVIEQLRGVRLDKGLSVECVARSVGVARQTLWDQESGVKMAVTTALKYLYRCGYTVRIVRREAPTETD